MHIAHIAVRDNCRTEQTVFEHCRRTAIYASENLLPIHLDKVGTLVGWLHDMGKCKEEMREYLTAAADGKNVVRGSVNHTFAGVIYLFERYHQGDCRGFREMTCEIAAYAIGAHHGLFDCINETAEDGFLHRLTKDRTEIHYDEAKANFLSECLSETEIDVMFDDAKEQVERFLSDMIQTSGLTANTRDYNIGILTRLVLSSLIDADRRDTSEFMTGTYSSEDCRNAEYWKRELDFTVGRLNSFSGEDSITLARRSISEQCCEVAGKKPGIYRLTLPTGSGKTLASLRYAQTHAMLYKERRIVYVIPLLSIIEQNADVWRRFTRCPGDILEHHSNVVESREENGNTDSYETVSVAWDSPYIITTLVQFLNALFSGKTDCIRRLHSLCDSVVIIDEVQSLPLKTLSVFNQAMNFLTRCCGMTLVLCSATQPCFDSVRTPLLFAEHPDLIKLDEVTTEVFKRTDVVFRDRKGGYSHDEICSLIAELFKTERSILVICNTKDSAGNVFDLLHETLPPDTELRYLSTALCPRHRRDILEKIFLTLNGKKRIVCVSTQLVEAGVDFSFSCVIRIVSGLDHIAQSAGRSNRNGELLPNHGKVIVLPCREEKLNHLPDIRYTQNAFYDFIHKFQTSPDDFDNDMLSEKSIYLYYKRLWSIPEVSADFDYPLPELNTTICSLMSGNKEFVGNRPALSRRYALHQAFHTAGSRFTVFDQDTSDVIVPYNEEARELIMRLQKAETDKDFTLLTDTVRRAGQYTVALYRYQISKLTENGGMCETADGHIRYLMPNFYDSETRGVMIDTVRCDFC